MNVGESSDEPNFDANPFGFFGTNFGEFGKDPCLKTGLSRKQVHECRSLPDRREF